MPKTRTHGPGSLSIGPVGSPQQWAGDTTKTTLTPKTDSEDPTPLLDGTNETGEDTTTYTLDVTILDDYDAGSLAKWTYDNKGKELPFVWTPNTAGKVKISGMVKIQPIAIGGDVKKKNSNDVSFTLVGDPTITDA
ncbi:MAG: hypothetical protein ACTH93_09125 [Pseudoclavibacter sp.]